jgi:MinD-like ATPase involved in chromosome partitioning or flagellar assembly
MARIAFVSFKGGAGRSVCLANTAVQLALRDNAAIGCVDADIESGGLNTIMDVVAPFDQFQTEATEWNGKFPVQVFLMQEQFRKELFARHIGDADTSGEASLVRDYFAMKVGADSRRALLRDALSGKNLFLLPSAPNADLTSRVDIRGDLYAHFLKLLDAFEEGCELKHRFVDCRAGISNLALPALAFVDATVVCLRLGLQHRIGTERFLTWYSRWLKRRDRKPNIYLLISLMVESGESSRIERERADGARFVDDLRKNTELSPWIKDHIFIPHVPALRDTDRVLLEDEFAEYQDIFLKVGRKLVSENDHAS